MHLHTDLHPEVVEFLSHASYLQRAYRSWPKDMGLQVSSLQLAFFFPFLKQKMGTRRATDYLPRQLLQQTVCSYAWGGLEAV